ncbi:MULTISPECIES: ABC transporter substrate-binding protein [unclassified Plantactinospora]|uniref:ABC transporter substrate-binding protein n=1 Tax=unclassified Plantactinospora TaxID=2631981 RepID=UPI000D177A79|nr:MULTISPECIES: ABC transporter substrate-binding protein [unclassified Plantactinospora]AVT29662.1 ABC transporter substrate-binding protein [Plantactinospora sp. BC1]AVT36064.1 ABC transporter substrate-binding protein [Plantactinospora sp. BB1]
MAEPERGGPGRSRRSRLAAALAALTLLGPLAACGSGDDGGVPTINLYYTTEQNIQKVVDDCNAKAGGRYRIAYRVLPRAADDQRVQLVRRLAAEDTGMDILGLDVTWTQEFASAGWLLEWTGERRAEVERGTLAGPLETARYEGKLYAAPKNTNVQLLWYRSDLVPQPPQTWDEMIRMAQDLRGRGQPYRVITMGAQYEGLVVLYNTLVASAGGQIINDDGSKAVFDEGAVRALEVLRNFATAGITTSSFSNTIEDQARLDFQSGAGAFQLNWPFVYPAMQEADPELAKKVRWARYPGVDPGTPSKVTIGGFNLGISRYTEHPEESFDAATCLRDAEHQKFSAINDGVPPTIESVYAEPEMAEAYPMRDTILEELKDPATRPRSPAYQNISTVLSATLSPPSAIDPERTADRMREATQDALDSKGVLP